MFSEEQHRKAIETFIRFDTATPTPLLSSATRIGERFVSGGTNIGSTVTSFQGNGSGTPNTARQKSELLLITILSTEKALHGPDAQWGIPVSSCLWMGSTNSHLTSESYALARSTATASRSRRRSRRVAELEARTGSAAEVAERYGMPRTEPYLWRKRIMGDNGGGAEEKGTAVSKEFDELPDDIDELRDMLREAQVQLIHGGDLRGTRQHLPRQARQTPFLSGGTKRALGY